MRDHPLLIPVFLGLSIMSGNFPIEEVEYLRRFEPIGCRDMYTLNLLRNKNIFSYLNGCMSVTMPKVELTETNKKVFLVDIPRSYHKYIPADLLNDAEEITHIREHCDEPEFEMKNLLNRYAAEARLIITTRLHSAWPSAGMGIPVVLMKDRASFRFSALGKYLHTYTFDEFRDIDWDPEPLDLEDIKEKLLMNAADRLKEAYNKYFNMLEISQYYETGITRKFDYVEHFSNVAEFIDKKWEKDDKIRYAIWGITHKADLICGYFEEHYSNAEFVAAFDAKRKVSFHGVNSMPIEEAGDLENIFIFVTTATLDKFATEYFAKIGKSDYFCSVDVESYGLNITT